MRSWNPTQRSSEIWRDLKTGEHAEICVFDDGDVVEVGTGDDCGIDESGGDGE